MDLLSLVGLVTKRRGDYISQAKALARKYNDSDKLEKHMSDEAILLVKGYRDKLMRWEEYERSLIDKTLVSALAAVYLGAKDNNPDAKIEKAWPIIVGDMLPPLVKFLAETKTYVDDGTLRLGDQTFEFADKDLIGAVPGAIDLEADELEGINPEEEGVQEADQNRAQGRTWKSLAQRVIRYIATPIYAFFNLGRFMRKQDEGFSEMRRISKHDKRVCKDCKDYDGMGWQPIGSLPMPGKGCRCYDRCRCAIEYR